MEAKKSIIQNPTGTLYSYKKFYRQSLQIYYQWVPIATVQIQIGQTNLILKCIKPMNRLPQKEIVQFQYQSIINYDQKEQRILHFQVKNYIQKQIYCLSLKKKSVCHTLLRILNKKGGKDQHKRQLQYSYFTLQPQEHSIQNQQKLISQKQHLIPQTLVRTLNQPNIMEAVYLIQRLFSTYSKQQMKAKSYPFQYAKVLFTQLYGKTLEKFIQKHYTLLLKLLELNPFYDRDINLLEEFEKKAANIIQIKDQNVLQAYDKCRKSIYLKDVAASMFLDSSSLQLIKSLIRTNWSTVLIHIFSDKDCIFRIQQLSDFNLQSFMKIYIQIFNDLERFSTKRGNDEDQFLEDDLTNCDNIYQSFVNLGFFQSTLQVIYKIGNNQNQVDQFLLFTFIKTFSNVIKINIKSSIEHMLDFSKVKPNLQLFKNLLQITKSCGQSLKYFILSFLKKFIGLDSNIRIIYYMFQNFINPSYCVYKKVIESREKYIQLLIHLFQYDKQCLNQVRRSIFRNNLIEDLLQRGDKRSLILAGSTIIALVSKNNNESILILKHKGFLQIFRNLAHKYQRLGGILGDTYKAVSKHLKRVQQITQNSVCRQNLNSLQLSDLNYMTF